MTACGCLRLLLVLPMLGSFVACTQDDDNGQVVATRLFGCPDLAGTYIVSKARQTGEIALAGEPWQQLSIAGARGKDLTFTWRRPWNTADDYLLHHELKVYRKVGLLPPMLETERELRGRADADEPWPKETIRVVRKHEYTCSGGQLRLKTGSRAMLARSVDGGLLSALVRRKVADLQLSIWCGDGCMGPSLSSHQQTLWMKAPVWPEDASMSLVDPAGTPYEDSSLR